MPLFQKNLFQNDAYDTGPVVPVPQVLADSVIGSSSLVVSAESFLAQAAVGADALAVTAFITLVDDAVGGDALSLGDHFEKYPGDVGHGGDILEIAAFISLYDSAVGSDVLLKSFLLPPIVDYPPFNIRDLFSEERPARPSSEDPGEGTDNLNVLALVSVEDTAEGKDQVSVDKQYPQLEAFHWLLAA